MLTEAHWVSRVEQSAQVWFSGRERRAAIRWACCSSRCRVSLDDIFLLSFERGSDRSYDFGPKLRSKGYLTDD